MEAHAEDAHVGVQDAVAPRAHDLQCVGFVQQHEESELFGLCAV